MLFPRTPRPRAILAPLLLLPLLSRGPLAAADCECGYRVTVPPANGAAASRSPSPLLPPPPPPPPPQQQQQQQFVVTDLLETNFANISDVARNSDWARQAFNTSAAQARGPYGVMMAPANVAAGGGGGDGGGDGALEITLRGGGADARVDGMVPGGEIDSTRRDLFYGSFRSSMRLTGVSGTVAAFFYYYNDTQEIDMEFLSREFDPATATFPVHLVLHSSRGAAATARLPFDPRAAFHEYRFDLVPGGGGVVVFLADGVVLAELGGGGGGGGGVAHAGHLALSHWSNGNPLWSGGPPAAAAPAAVLAVRYVKAYFNSSDGARQAAFARRCGGGAAAAGAGAGGAVCDVPDVVPGNDAAAGWFFSGHAGMAAGQTVAADSGIVGAGGGGGAAAAARARGLAGVVVVVAAAAVGWVLWV